MESLCPYYELHLLGWFSPIQTIVFKSWEQQLSFNFDATTLVIDGNLATLIRHVINPVAVDANPKIPWIGGPRWNHGSSLAPSVQASSVLQEDDTPSVTGDWWGCLRCNGHLLNRLEQNKISEDRLKPAVKITVTCTSPSSLIGQCRSKISQWDLILIQELQGLHLDNMSKTCASVCSLKLHLDYVKNLKVL